MMNEALERLRGVRELPLFPLPLVLFPGVPLPLHVFEERYRRLLADVRAGNQMFGVSYFDPEVATGTRPAPGDIGCVAEVVETQPLPDGRANVMTLGLVRYRIESYVDAGDPYLVARVEFFADDPEDEAELAARAREVGDLFQRIARSVRKLNDDRASLPDLPDAEPERLSFLVAAAMEMEAERKQELLELRSGLQRLKRIRDLLNQVVNTYEDRARVHAVAKTNGHAGKPPELDA